MSQSSIFVNLPVEDLDRSKEFFTALGWSINPQFTSGDGACLVVSEHISVMLLRKPFFSTFTDKPIADAASSEVILALGCDSRAEVDAVAEAALAAGGTPSSEAQDHGFMYSRAFADPDGHLWEVVWMDPGHVEG